MLDYPSLFALAAVIHEGSFERAAKALNVTPSAVSQRIRLLEERLGCTLVIRSQPCQPTEIARRLCQHVDQVRLLEHELYVDMPNSLSEDPVWINVPLAVNADSLATWFMAASSEFAANAPALLQVVVDDEGHTAEWLRNGQVLAAVTATSSSIAGCNCLALGTMRYVAAATPAFIAKYFPTGINAESLSKAPSLTFSTKDVLQQRWVERQCGQGVQMPGHTLPSSQAFVAATLLGLGWGMHPEPLVRQHLASGALVELKSGCLLDVPLYWQHTRMTSSLLSHLTSAVIKAAKEALVEAHGPMMR